MKQTALSGAAAAVVPRAGVEAAGAQTTPVAPSDRITLGLLGAGARVQQLIEAAKQVPDFEVVALCDAYTGRTERARARTGGRAAVHGDYREILARADVDAVIVGTPDHLHAAMSVAALQAGKDAYIEKPMTHGVDEGLGIVDAARKANRIVQVGSQGVSSAIDAHARELVRSGRLGQVTLIRASYNRNSAGGAWLYPIPPDASPATVNWEQFLGPAPRRPFDLERFFRWRCYWDYGGGISGDLFVHLLSTIHFVMGATMPATVLASGELHRWKQTHEVPDTVNAVLVYPEGFTVLLSSTFNNQSSSESGFSILGTEGSISFRGDRLEFTPEQVQENNRWVVTSWPDALEKAHYADPKVQARESPWLRPPAMEAAGQRWEEQGWDSTVAHLASFARAIRSRQPPVEDALFGHRAASAAHMVNLAMRQKRLVEWDFSAERVKGGTTTSA